MPTDLWRHTAQWLLVTDIISLHHASKALCLMNLLPSHLDFSAVAVYSEGRRDDGGQSEGVTDRLLLQVARRLACSKDKRVVDLITCSEVTVSGILSLPLGTIIDLRLPWPLTAAERRKIEDKLCCGAWTAELRGQGNDPGILLLSNSLVLPSENFFVHWRVPAFPQRHESVKSPAFAFAGHKWRGFLFPLGNHGVPEWREDFVSMYIECATAIPARGRVRGVSLYFSLTICHPRSRQLHHTMASTDSFAFSVDHKPPDRGWHKLIRRSRLFEQGFLDSDDSLLIKIGLRK